ncbi:MAG: HU family DNA-binding protein [Bacteroidales bacterium]|jgi:predicted histone-like DNA-binding protein|nr:HU family DNA-binding protein [Bacteroidales bacterium]
MAIGYVKIQRKINVGGNPGIKFLARVFRKNTVNLDTIAREISGATSLSYADVLASLKAFEIHVSRHVLNGEGVKLELLGSFNPAIKATAQDSLTDVTVDTIKRAKVRFVPSPYWKNSLDKSLFEEVKLKVDGLQLPSGTLTPVTPGSH